MARLPTTGGDSGVWGDILNEFLAVEHNTDGTLKTGGSLAGKANDSAVVHLTGAETVTGTKTFSASPIVPTPTSGTQAATKAYVDSTVSSGAPDATTSVKGIVQLAGHLTGTADLPTIASGVIIDANIAGGAAIAQSKIANLTTDLAAKQALNADLSAIVALTPVNNDILQRKSGAWTNRTVDQVKTDLAITKTDVALGNVPNVDATARANHTGTQTASTISDFNTAADARITVQKGANSGLATLDSSGKIPSSQLSPIAITDTFVVGSQAAMLALAATTGDVAIRTDTNESYILQGSDPTQLGDWQELLNSGVVASVNGQDGVVTLTTTNITEGTNLYYTEGRVSANATVVAKAADSAVVHNTADETVAGVKTFSSSPIVPTPTTGTQAANKTYVDTKATAASLPTLTAIPAFIKWDGSSWAARSTATASTSVVVFWVGGTTSPTTMEAGDIWLREGS